MRPQHVNTNRPASQGLPENPSAAAAEVKKFLGIFPVSGWLPRVDTSAVDSMRRHPEPRVFHKTIRHGNYTAVGDFVRKGIFGTQLLRGKVTFNDGKILQGTFQDGHNIRGPVNLVGPGTYTDANGNTLSGNFHGEWLNVNDFTLYSYRVEAGIKTFSSGTVHTGNFCDGVLDGPGKITFEAGNELSKIEGEFHHGSLRRSSVAKFFYVNGEIHEGYFHKATYEVQYKQAGMGTITYPDGLKLTAVFRNGKPYGDRVWSSDDYSLKTNGTELSFYDKNDQLINNDLIAELAPAFILHLPEPLSTQAIDQLVKKNNYQQAGQLLAKREPVNIALLPPLLKLDGQWQKALSYMEKNHTTCFKEIMDHYFQQLPEPSKKLHQHQPALGINNLLIENQKFAIESASIREIAIPPHEADFEKWQTLVAQLKDQQQIPAATANAFLSVMQNLETQAVPGVKTGLPWYPTQYARLGWIMHHVTEQQTATASNPQKHAAVLRDIGDTISAISKFEEFCGPGLEDELIVHYNGWVSQEAPLKSTTQIALQRLVNRYFEGVIRRITDDLVKSDNSIGPSQEVHVLNQVRQLGEVIFGLHEHRHDVFSRPLSETTNNSIQQKIMTLVTPAAVIDLLHSSLPPAENAEMQTDEAVELLKDFFIQSHNDSDPERIHDWLSSNYDENFNFTREAVARMLVSAGIFAGK